MKEVYLDYNATTPLDRRVFEAMRSFLEEQFYNPSSVYMPAQRVRSAVEEARAKVAALIAAEESEIIFTSGGTEADNLAIKGVAFSLADRGKHIITSRIEHHAVLSACEFLEKLGYEITYLPVDSYGIVDLDALKRSIRKDTILISIMWANNEIGTLQPVAEIAEIAHKYGVIFHTDAVQAVGKIPVDVEKVGVDMLSLSAHKFYGPKGAGALYVRKGLRLEALLHGGHQEKRLRAGTENVAGIVGMGKAAEIALEEMGEEERRIRPLRDRLEKEITRRIPEVVITGHPEKRLFNTLNVCVKYVEGESILMSLDMEGIRASSGSACTSGSLEPSHVLLALGLPHEVAHGSLRFSFGKFNTEEDVKRVAETLPPIVERLREMSPFWKEKFKEGRRA